MPAAVCFPGKVSRFQSQLRKEEIDQRGFAHGRLPREAGDAILQNACELFFSGSCFCRNNGGLEPWNVVLFKCPDDLLIRCIAFVQDQNRLDSRRNSLNDQFIHKLPVRSRCGGGNNDQKLIDIRHGRADQEVFPWKDFLNGGMPLFLIFINNKISDDRRDAAPTEMPACLAFHDCPARVGQDIIETADSSDDSAGAHGCTASSVKFTSCRLTSTPLI